MKKIIAIFQLLAFSVFAQCHNSVSACTSSVAIVMKDGTLFSWGNTFAGTLGDGIIKESLLSPTKIGSSTNWKFVSTGELDSWGIKTDGSLWHTGAYSYSNKVIDTVFKQVGIETDWKNIDAENRVAIKTDGTIWVYNSASFPLFKQIGSDTDWEKIVSHFGCLAIKSDSTLWNLNYSTGVKNQIGNKKWLMVSNFYDSFYGLQSDHTAWYGIINNPNQLIQIDSENNWKFITYGSGVKTDGSLWNIRYNSPSSRIGIDNDWTELYYNQFMMQMAIKNNGDIYTWGSGVQGDGSAKVDHNQPNKILAPCVVTEIIIKETNTTTDDVYPIPTSDVIYINSKPEVVSLTDMYGKITTLNGNGTYHIGGIAKGLYILSYINGTENIIKKLELK